jgi:hypothetical protein
VIPGRGKRFFGSPEYLYCVRVKNLFICISTPPFEFMAWYIIKHIYPCISNLIPSLIHKPPMCVLFI